MRFLTSAHLQFLFDGLLWTVGLSLLAFVGGGLLGFVVALGTSYGPRWSRLVVSLYVKLIQGTPLLVLLPLAYFGLPSLGLNVPPLGAAALALSIYVSAYLGEIWRGCIESVPRTQAEAAECLALRWHQRVIHVILPQAVKIATPPPWVSWCRSSRTPRWPRPSGLSSSLAPGKSSTTRRLSRLSFS